VKLFDRVGRQIVITEYGEIFSKSANEILYLLNNAQSEIEMLAGQESNSIGICWNYAGYMEKLLLQYIDEHPQITVNQYQVPEDRLCDELLKPHCDFLIAETDQPGYQPFQKLVFPDLKWYLAIPAEHPLAGVDSPRLAQFAGDSFSVISLNPGHMMITKRLCKHAGFECNIAYRATPNICLALVADKKYLTLVNEDMAMMAKDSALYADKIRFIRLSEEDLVVHISLLWDGKKKLSKAAQEFLDYMRKHLQEAGLLAGSKTTES
jgi:DNA-binding transcriptional LysR family regulator